jgi:hypothetical protein
MSRLKSVETEKAKKVLPKPRKPPKTKTSGYCSMSKKEIGDGVHGALKLEKYKVQRTTVEVKSPGLLGNVVTRLISRQVGVDTALFKPFFITNESLCEPPEVGPSHLDKHA